MQGFQDTLGKYDFDSALKDGLSKTNIIDSLRNQYDTNVDWERMNAHFKDLPKQEQDEAIFDSLYAYQDSWGIFGEKESAQDLPTQATPESQNGQAQPQEQNPLNPAQVTLEPSAQQETAQSQETENIPHSIQSLLNQTEPNQEARDLPEPSALDYAKGFLGNLTGTDFKNVEEHNTAIKNYLKEGGKWENLPTPLKAFALSQAKLEPFYQDEIQKDNTRISLMETDEKGHYKKSFKDLSDAEKDLIKSDLGFFNSVFTSEQDELKEWREKQKINAQDEAVQTRLKVLRNVKNDLDRYHKEKNIFNLLSADEQTKDEYLTRVNDFATSLGFDGIGIDQEGGRLFVYEGEKALWINDGFFDNALEILETNKYDIALSVLGGIAGGLKASAKAAGTIAQATPAGKMAVFAGGVLGSAIGAYAGGVLDSLTSQARNNEDLDWEALENATRTGTESAVFDLAGGAVVGAVLKNGVKILKAPITATEWVSSKITPLATLKNALGDQNIKAAQEFVENGLSAGEKEDIKAFAQEFGGNLKTESPEILHAITESIAGKYGSDSLLTKLTKKLENYATEHNKTNAQRELLELIRADSSGHSLGILYQVAKSSPQANNNLKTLLNRTTQELQNTLKSLEINPTTTKEIFRDLETGTKESYNEATNKILLELYEGEKVTLERGKYDTLRQELEDTLALETSALGFLKFVENGIFNPNGVDLNQLINARKTLNTFIKDTQDTNTKKYLTRLVENHLKDTINAGIDSILSSNPQTYQKAKTLYETSLKDYATMKATMKNLKELGFLDVKKTEEEILDNLISYAKGSGGLEGKNNFAELTKGLSEQNRQTIELNALNQIFNRNLLRGEGGEVFNSNNFLREVEKLEEVFTSKGAKEFISLMKGFNRLFGNDAEIAIKLGYATPKVEGSSIAQSIQGALNQKIVKGIFATLMRNLPADSLGVRALGLSDSVKAQALRYHLTKALENANDLTAFKTNLTQQATKGGFNNNTQQAINDFLNDLETLHKETLAEVETKQRHSDKQLNYEIIQKIQNSAQKGRDMEIIGKENFTPEVIDYLLSAQGGSKKVAVDLLPETKAKELGFKYPQNVRRTIDKAEIIHALNRHGENGEITKARNQPPLTKQELAKWTDYADNADVQVLSKDDLGQDVIVSGKQINGHYVVVESLRKGQNELSFKTMYFENGDLKKNEAFNLAISKDTPSTQGYKPELEQKASIKATKSKSSVNSLDLDSDILAQPTLNSEIIETSANVPALRTSTQPKVLEPTEIIDAEIIESAPLVQQIEYKTHNKRAQVIQDLEKQLKALDQEATTRAENGDPTAFILKKYQHLENKKLELEKKQIKELGESTKHSVKAQAKLAEIDTTKLTREQQEVLKVFKGELETAIIQGKDLNDIYALEKGSRQKGARKILIKHYGVEKTGGLSDDELLSMGEVIQKGALDSDSFELKDDFLRYAYDFQKDNVKLRVVVDEYNDGKKIFNFYSDRNFTDFKNVEVTGNNLPTSDTILTQPTLNHEQRLEKVLEKQQLQDNLDFKAFKNQDKAYDSLVLKYEKAQKEHTKAKELFEKIKQDENSSMKAKEKAFNTKERLKNQLEKLEQDLHIETHKFIRPLYYFSLKNEDLGDLSAQALEPLIKKYYSDKKVFQKALENSTDELDFQNFAKSQEYVNAGYGVMTFDKNGVLIPIKKGNKLRSDAEIAQELQQRKAESPKEKTIKAVDSYAQTAEFKALSKDKQDAILSLKTIKPAQMPEGISVKEFENLRAHFENKADQAQREAYLKLFELTKQEPDIVLNVLRNGELREEYIKAFQHKENKDLYYLSITKDEREITGIPTTQVKKVINEIARSEKVNAEALQKITNPAEPMKNLNSELSGDILAQIPQEVQELWLKTFNLKSLDEDFIPTFTPEIQEILQKEGIGEIKLKSGSLEKLMNRDRLEFLDKIKPTLETPDIILKHLGDLIFIKDIGKEAFFTSVTKNSNGEWIVTSNAFKTLQTLKNKLQQEAETIYLNKEASNILAEAFTPKTFLRQLDSDMVSDSNLIKGDTANLSAYSDEFNPLLTSKDEPLNSTDILAQNSEISQDLPKGKVNGLSDTLALITAQSNTSYEQAFKNIKKTFRDNTTIDPEIKKRVYTKIDEAKAEADFKALRLNEKWAKNFTSDKFFKFLSGKLPQSTLVFEKEKEAYKDFIQNSHDKEFLTLEALKFYRSLEKNKEFMQINERRVKKDKWGNTKKRSYDEIMTLENWKQRANIDKEMLELLFKKEELKGQFTHEEFFSNYDDFDFKIRRIIENSFNIHPIKEFGTNYAQFYRDGKGAIEKLLNEKQGQVAGAFYRKDLEELSGSGEITLVWGEVAGEGAESSGYGLAKILEKHLDDFTDFAGATKEEKLANAIAEIVEKGKLVSDNNVNTLWLKKDDEYYLAGVSKGFNGNGENNWIITSYKKTKGEIPKELKGDTANLSAYSDEFNPLLTSKDEPLNSNPIIPQIQEKFNFNTQKAKDLYEWHKESHPLTKDEQGLPKVFYHGSRAENLEEFDSRFSSSGYGFWFSALQNEAKAYMRLKENDSYLIKGFLKSKKPFIADDITEQKYNELKQIFKDDLTPEIWEKYLTFKKEFDSAKRQIERKGYKLADFEQDAVNLKTKDGNFLELQKNPYSKPTRLLDTDMLKRAGMHKIAQFINEKSKFYLKNSQFGTSDIDLLMDIMDKADYSYNKYYLREKLQSAGYDGIKLNDDIFIIFDSNQIKAVSNKGAKFDEKKGEWVKASKKDLESGKASYFNESSPNIYHSNPHLGAGLLSGSVAGVEEDEQGNLTFNPQKFALGFLGGALGSKAMQKGFKILKENPELREKVAQELSNTLSKGWESAVKTYPILSTLQPLFIMKSEKGRILQAQRILSKVFIQNNKIIVHKLNSYAITLPKKLKRQEFINQIPNKDERGYSIIETKIGSLKINLKHAWNHLNKGNTYKKDRTEFSGAFLDTLTDPLFIVKQEYIPNPKVSLKARANANSQPVQIKDSDIVAQDSYVFFKPYKNRDNFSYIAGYAIDSKGELINTTLIPLTYKDFTRIQKMLESEVLYFKDSK